MMPCSLPGPSDPSSCEGQPLPAQWVVPETLRLPARGAPTLGSWRLVCDAGCVWMPDACTASCAQGMLGPRCRVTVGRSPWPVLGAGATAVYGWPCAGGSIISAQNRGNPGGKGLGCDSQSLCRGPANHVLPWTHRPPLAAALRGYVQTRVQRHSKLAQTSRSRAEVHFCGHSEGPLPEPAVFCLVKGSQLRVPGRHNSLSASPSPLMPAWLTPATATSPSTPR